MANLAIIGNAQDFFARQADEHMIAFRWNKRIAGYQLDKRNDCMKIEIAKIAARVKK